MTVVRIENKNIWFRVLVFYLVLGSDALLFTYNMNPLLPQAAEYITVGISICMFFYMLFKQSRNYSSSIGWTVLICVWIVFLGIYHGEFSGGYISKISLFLLGASFFCLFDTQKFIEEYCKAMRIICIVSLAGILLSPIITNLGFLPTIRNNVGYEFKCLLFTNVCIPTPFRNYGPFSEPSRYQAFINLYLIFLLFGDGDKEKRGSSLLFGVMTLVSTFSTTGYISFLLILVAFILKKNAFIRGWKKGALIVAAIISIVVLLNLNENFLMATKKAFMGTSSLSYTVRMNAILADLKIIEDNFIFGTGIRNNQEIFMNTVRTFSSNQEFTNTNTLLMAFAKFGVIVGGFYTLKLIHAIKKLSQGLSAVTLFVAVAIMMSGISLLDSMVFNIIVFMGIGISSSNSCRTHHRTAGMLKTNTLGKSVRLEGDNYE